MLTIRLLPVAVALVAMCAAAALIADAHAAPADCKPTLVKPPPKKPPQKPPVVPPSYGVAYYGDSAAYWTGRHLYSTAPSLRVENRASGGYTLAKYVAVNHAEALKFGKGVVVLSFGANDADSRNLDGIAVDQWRDELARVALDLRQRGLGVVIETVPAMQLERLAPDALAVPLPAMQQAAREAAIASGAVLCDRYSWMRARPNPTSDGVHLTDAALRGWAPHLVACLAKAQGGTK